MNYRFLLCLILILGFSCVSAQIITVDNDEDDGAGTFREAIEVLAQDGDTIEFAVNKIKLENRILLEVDNITIQGPVVLDGQKRTKILGVDSDNVVIDQVAFVNANDNRSGGSALSLTGDGADVTNCVFQNNFAIISGAAIDTEGDVDLIDNCVFVNNSCNISGAAITVENNTIALISNCVFSKNSIVGDVIDGGSGGAINVGDNGTITQLTGCLFSGNSAQIDGGAILIEGQADVAIDTTIFENNEAELGEGGAIAFNLGDDDANAGGTLSIIECIFDKNSARTKGGALAVFAGQTVNEITDTTFSNNSTDEDNGGAINNDGTITVIQRSTFEKNKTNFNGGGLFNDINGVVDIDNSTFSANQAKLDGGGIFDDGGTVSLDSVTITKNKANEGGGVFTEGDLTVNSQNSIIAENVAKVQDDISSPNGDFLSNDFNLIGVVDDNDDQGFNQANDQVGLNGVEIDPELDNLADNGGLTETHAINAGSPAEDLGGTDLVEDQRALARVVNDDIGSFELEAVVADVPTVNETRQVLARNIKRGIFVAWYNANENVVGYHVWRRVSGDKKFTKISQSLIMSTAAMRNFQYSLIDSEFDAKKVYFYRIECVTNDGKNHFCEKLGTVYTGKRRTKKKDFSLKIKK